MSSIQDKDDLCQHPELEPPGWRLSLVFLWAHPVQCELLQSCPKHLRSPALRACNSALSLHPHGSAPGTLCPSQTWAWLGAHHKAENPAASGPGNRSGEPHPASPAQHPLVGARLLPGNPGGSGISVMTKPTTHSGTPKGTLLDNGNKNNCIN